MIYSVRKALFALYNIKYNYITADVRPQRALESRRRPTIRPILNAENTSVPSHQPNHSQSSMHDIQLIDHIVKSEEVSKH